jgi:translation initiation factor RLI1
MDLQVDRFGVCSDIETREVVMNDEYMKFLHHDFKQKSNEMLFKQGKSFKLNNEEQTHFYGTILRYFARNKSFYDSKIILNKGQADLSKGLLVLGGNGVGKTFVFRVMHELNQMLRVSENQFSFSCSDEIVHEFNKGGIEAIQRMFVGQRYFDDLGTEEVGSHYGQSELMRVVLQKRHDLFIETGKKTFMTSNYGQEELMKRYGNRAESRLFEMFNIIAFTGVDRRKKEN